MTVYRYRQTSNSVFSQAPGTMSLIIVIALVYLVTMVESGSLAHNLSGSSVADLLTLNYREMTSSPLGPLRAIGYAFLHSGASHFIMNSIMLFLFGREIERFTGPVMLIAMFITGAVGSAALITYLDPLTYTVGASGAVYAFMGIALGMAMRARANTRSIVVLILVNLGFTVIFPGISLWGHIGGLIAGCIIGGAIALGAKRNQTFIVVGIVFLLSVASLAFMLGLAGR